MTATTTPPTSKRRRPAKPKPAKWPDFVGSWPRLTGRQEPEFESRHPGDESEGDRCAQFGKNVGLRCMPWEWQTLRGILSLQPANEFGERLWTHRDVAIECTRQQGKTLLIVLLILFHLFVKPVLGRARTHKIIYTAQQWTTVSDVFDRVEEVIMRVPSLRKRLAKNPSKRDNHGVIEVALKRDKLGKPVVVAKAEFGPRSLHFARGYTEVDLLILDEAYDVDPVHEANLTGSQSAAPNPQTVSISTAPVFAEHPRCHMLADLHRQGHRRARDLFYRLFAAPRHLSRDEPAAWELAQPSYGVATNEREIRSKCEKAKHNARRRAIFDADYLGWGDYPPPELEGDSAISAQGWKAMGPHPDQPPPTLVGRVALALERSPDGAVWTIEAAQRTTDARVHIEMGYSDTVSDADFVTAVAEAVAALNPVVVVIRAGSGAAEIEDALRVAGVEAEMVNQTEVAAWCGGFLSAGLDGRLSHRGQSELADAVSAAVKRKLPRGGFIWELIDEASYAYLMGSSLAHGALIKFGGPSKRKPASPTGGENRTKTTATRRTRRGGEKNVMELAF